MSDWNEETRKQLEEMARDIGLRAASSVNDWVSDKLLRETRALRAALAELDRLAASHREDREEIERLRAALKFDMPEDFLMHAQEMRVRAEAAEAKLAALRAEPEERMAERQAGIDQGQQ